MCEGNVTWEKEACGVWVGVYVCVKMVPQRSCVDRDDLEGI